MEEQIIKKNRKPLWRRILKRFLLGIVVLLLLLFVGSIVLLTPKRLTPIAERVIDSFISADVRFDTLKVSLFQDFPYINLTIINGLVRSRVFDTLPPLQQEALPSGCDSLLRFEEVSVSLHLPKLIKSQVDIRRVRLSGAKVNAYISPTGLANWEVYSSNTTAVESDTEAFQLHLQRLILRNGFRFTYRSVPDSLSASFDCHRLFLRGAISDQIEAVQLETLAASGIHIGAQTDDQQWVMTSIMDSLRFGNSSADRYTIFLQSINSLMMDKTAYATSLPVEVSGEVGFSLYRLDSLFFKDFTLSAAQMPVQLDGSLVFAQPRLKAKLQCRIDSLSAMGILKLLPPALLPGEVKDVRTDIWAKIVADVDYPGYSVDLRTWGGYLDYPDAQAHIHSLALDASYTHRPNQPQLSGINVRQCDVEASGISLHAQGVIRDLLGDPDIDLSLQGDLLLDTLYRILPFSQDVTARGALNIEANAKFLLSNFLHGNIDASALRGRVDAERLLFRLPKDSILIMARGGHLSFGANQNQRDTTLEQGMQILRLSFRADSANVRYKRQFRLALSNTRLSARSAASILKEDTAHIHPLNGALEAGYLSFQTADSTRFSLNQGSCTFGLAPAANDPALPVITTRLKAQFAAMSDPENKYELFSPQITLQATRLPTRPSATRSTTRTPQMRPDSLQNGGRSPRPSNRAPDDFASENLDFEADDNTKLLLRHWQLQGAIEAEGGALSTLFFPLPITLGGTDLEISLEEIQLMQTQITAGRSRIECTGKISNLRQVLLGRGTLGVSGFVRADTLDLNELMRAANAGSLYADNGIVIPEMEEASSLLIIPANLNLNLKLFADFTHYGDEFLTGLSGALSSRNRNLQISDLEAATSFGSFKLSALYATRSRTDITAGFDLDMSNVQVERVIALLPSIDTLAPMLRSFEGMVDCQISATTSMDTEMNLLLPTLTAACRIRGVNMVLLDGETFTEISKMLYFKNKNRNLIDHIAVDFLIHDNKIEVFPFIMEMDRYRAAVSGIHNLDMSFDYHISVLHSPIPFKLGINVTGTMDDLHYRLAQCRYRNANIPSYVELIDATRMDLLQAIKAFDPAAAFRSVDRTVSRAARIREEEETTPPQDENH